MDWGKSWEIHSVDEQQWNRIQVELRNEYVTLLESIDANEWNELLANEVLSLWLIQPIILEPFDKC